MSACPRHPQIDLPYMLTCPLCAQEARAAAYRRQKPMTNLSQDEMEELAERMGKIAEGTLLEDFLGVLGVIVFNALCQFKEEDRFQAVAAWIATLFRELAKSEIKRKSN